MRSPASSTTRSRRSARPPDPGRPRLHLIVEGRIDVGDECIPQTYGYAGLFNLRPLYRDLDSDDDDDTFWLWYAPSTASIRPPGTMVVVHGLLRARSELNGVEGTVLREQGERMLVQLNDARHTSLAFNPKNLKARLGCWVISNRPPDAVLEDGEDFTIWAVIETDELPTGKGRVDYFSHNVEATGFSRMQLCVARSR